MRPISPAKLSTMPASTLFCKKDCCVAVTAVELGLALAAACVDWIIVMVLPDCVTVKVSGSNVDVAVVEVDVGVGVIDVDVCASVEVDEVNDLLLYKCQPFNIKC